MMKRLAKALAPLLATAIALPILIVVLPPLLLWWLVWGAVLRLWFWFAHRRHGRHVLFVYSESPNWQSYIEASLLPHVEPHAVVLNWSRRKKWNRETWWEARVFDHWAGSRSFNPLALVFVGPWRVRTIRFFQAFHDLKHGEEQPLRRAEAELLAHLNAMQAAG